MEAWHVWEAQVYEKMEVMQRGIPVHCLILTTIYNTAAVLFLVAAHHFNSCVLGFYCNLVLVHNYICLPDFQYGFV